MFFFSTALYKEKRLDGFLVVVFKIYKILQLLANSSLSHKVIHLEIDGKVTST